MRTAQAFRIDDDTDVDRETAFDFIEVQVHRDHPANFHPQKLYRCIDLQAAHRLIEPQHQELRVAGRRCQRTGLVGKQLVALVLAGGRVVRVVVRRAEGDAADQDRRQRLGFQRKTIGADLHINAAGVPEACVGAHEGVVGCMDEDLHVHPFTFLVEGVGDHLADRDLAVIHVRTDVQRA
ncbi:hypothetical protein D3C80_1576540 [compost metagenome]